MVYKAVKMVLWPTYYYQAKWGGGHHPEKMPDPPPLPGKAKMNIKLYTLPQIDTFVNQFVSAAYLYCQINGNIVYT